MTLITEYFSQGIETEQADPIETFIQPEGEMHLKNMTNNM